MKKSTDINQHRSEINGYSGLKNLRILKYLSLSGQLGLVMIISILIWFFLSRFLIRIFGLGDIWLAVGVILGVFTGMTGCYKLLQKIVESHDQHDKK